MGYRGLLLNAPYKIDSMMRMRLMIRFGCFSFNYSSFLYFLLGYMNQG
jgi:hypothetical protein